jgi:hypothetical protein
MLRDHRRRRGPPARHCEDNPGQEDDHIFSLKGNQGRLHNDAKLFVEEQEARRFNDAKISPQRSAAARAWTAIMAASGRADI